MIGTARSRTGIKRLSRSTNLCDIHSVLVKDYLREIGHFHHRIAADAEVWVRYERGRVVRVGPTQESVSEVPVA